MLKRSFYWWRGLMVTLALLLAFLPASPVPVAAKKSDPQVPGAPTAYRKLSGDIPAFADVGLYQISPDGRYAVFYGDLQADYVYNVYSVQLSGGAPVRLSGNLLPDALVSFKISPDGSRVVYATDQDVAGQLELYSVPIAGPAEASIKLNGELPPGGNVFGDFRISPDGSRVIYSADQQVAGTYELYSVPVAGPASAGVKLNVALPDGARVNDFQISPDGSRVVYNLFIYNAAQQAERKPGLYSVLVAGPASASLPLAESNFLPSSIGKYSIVPDGSRVIFTSKVHDIYPDDLLYDLYSVPINGPVNAGIRLNGVSAILGDYQISPDSNHVLYLQVPENVSGQMDLYSVPVAGPAVARVKLNSEGTPGGNVWSFQFNQDGSRVVYAADQELLNKIEIYSVPTGGPASTGVKLNGMLPDGGKVDSYQISPDGSRVVYKANQDDAGLFELYSVPVTGPASAGVKLNDPLPTGGYLAEFTISPDSRQVIYLAAMMTAGVELFRAPVDGPDGSGPAGPVNGPLVANGRVDSFQVTPGSGRVVYHADAEVDEKWELYIADAGPASVSFPSATVRVGESVGTMNLRAALSADRVEAAQVDYAVTDDTATAGQDFTLAAGTITFAPGETWAVIPLRIVKDNLDEADETVVITLSDPNNASLGSTTTLTVTIYDDFPVYLPIAIR